MNSEPDYARGGEERPRWGPWIDSRREYDEFDPREHARRQAAAQLSYRPRQEDTRDQEKFAARRPPEPTHAYKQNGPSSSIRHTDNGRSAQRPVEQHVQSKQAQARLHHMQPEISHQHPAMRQDTQVPSPPRKQLAKSAPSLESTRQPVTTASRSYSETHAYYANGTVDVASNREYNKNRDLRKKDRADTSSPAAYVAEDIDCSPGKKTSPAKAPDSTTAMQSTSQREPLTSKGKCRLAIEKVYKPIVVPRSADAGVHDPADIRTYLSDSPDLSAVVNERLSLKRIRTDFLRTALDNAEAAVYRAPDEHETPPSVVKLYPEVAPCESLIKVRDPAELAIVRQHTHNILQAAIKDLNERRNKLNQDVPAETRLAAVADDRASLSEAVPAEPACARDDADTASTQQDEVLAAHQIEEVSVARENDDIWDTPEGAAILAEDERKAYERAANASEPNSAVAPDTSEKASGPPQKPSSPCLPERLVSAVALPVDSPDSLHLAIPAVVPVQDSLIPIAAPSSEYDKERGREDGAAQDDMAACAKTLDLTKDVPEDDVKNEAKPKPRQLQLTIATRTEQEVDGKYVGKPVKDPEAAIAALPAIATNATKKRPAKPKKPSALNDQAIATQRSQLSDEENYSSAAAKRTEARLLENGLVVELGDVDSADEKDATGKVVKPKPYYDRDENQEELERREVKEAYQSRNFVENDLADVAGEDEDDANSFTSAKAAAAEEEELDSSEDEDEDSAAEEGADEEEGGDEEEGEEEEEASAEASKHKKPVNGTISSKKRRRPRKTEAQIRDAYLKEQRRGVARELKSIDAELATQAPRLKKTRTRISVMKKNGSYKTNVADYNMLKEEWEGLKVVVDTLKENRRLQRDYIKRLERGESVSINEEHKVIFNSDDHMAFDAARKSMFDKLTSRVGNGAEIRTQIRATVAKGLVAWIAAWKKDRISALKDMLGEEHPLIQVPELVNSDEERTEPKKESEVPGGVTRSTATIVVDLSNDHAEGDEEADGTKREPPAQHKEDRGEEVPLKKKSKKAKKRVGASNSLTGEPVLTIVATADEPTKHKISKKRSRGGGQCGYCFYARLADGATGTLPDPVPVFSRHEPGDAEPHWAPQLTDAEMLSLPRAITELEGVPSSVPSGGNLVAYLCEKDLPAASAPGECTRLFENTYAEALNMIAFKYRTSAGETSAEKLPDSTLVRILRLKEFSRSHSDVHTLAAWKAFFSHEYDSLAHIKIGEHLKPDCSYLGLLADIVRLTGMPANSPWRILCDEMERARICRLSTCNFSVFFENSKEKALSPGEVGGASAKIRWIPGGVASRRYSDNVATCFEKLVIVRLAMQESPPVAAATEVTGKAYERLYACHEDDVQLIRAFYYAYHFGNHVGSAVCKFLDKEVGADPAIKRGALDKRISKEFIEADPKKKTQSRMTVFLAAWNDARTRLETTAREFITKFGTAIDSSLNTVKFLRALFTRDTAGNLDTIDFTNSLNRYIGFHHWRQCKRADAARALAPPLNGTPISVVETSALVKKPKKEKKRKADTATEEPAATTPESNSGKKKSKETDSEVLADVRTGEEGAAPKQKKHKKAHVEVPGQQVHVNVF